MSTLFDKLMEPASPLATTWKPQRPDDLVIGKVLAIEEVTTQHGQQRLVKVAADRAVSDGVELPAATYVVWATTVLEKQFASLDLQAGHTVAIRFLGLAPAKAGMSPAKLFKTVAEPVQF